MTHVRLFDLGEGGLMAVRVARGVGRRTSAPPARLVSFTSRTLAAAAGLATIGASGFLYTPATPFSAKVDSASGTAFAGFVTINSNRVPDMVATGILEGVVLHEMGHAQGFGILWNLPCRWDCGPQLPASTGVTRSWCPRWTRTSRPRSRAGGGRRPRRTPTCRHQTACPAFP